MLLFPFCKFVSILISYNSEMDADGDGKVNFPEFLLAWKYKFT